MMMIGIKKKEILDWYKVSIKEVSILLNSSIKYNRHRLQQGKQKYYKDRHFLLLQKNVNRAFLYS